VEIETFLKLSARGNLREFNKIKLHWLQISLHKIKIDKINRHFNKIIQEIQISTNILDKKTF
jgi:hypothetical protein